MRSTRWQKFNKKVQFALYESRPVSLTIISLYSIIFPTHMAMQTAGIVLMGCTLIVCGMRLRHRGYIHF